MEIEIARIHFQQYCLLCLEMAEEPLTDSQKKVLKRIDRKAVFAQIEAFDEKTRAYFGITEQAATALFLQRIKRKNGYEQKLAAYPRLSDVEKRDAYRALEADYFALKNDEGCPKYFTDFLAKYPLPPKPQDFVLAEGSVAENEAVLLRLRQEQARLRQEHERAKREQELARMRSVWKKLRPPKNEDDT